MSFKFKAAEIGVFNQHHADNALAGFQSGCRLMGLTSGKFSLIDLIHSVLKKTGKAHVVCVTWSAGIKDVHQIKWMLDTELIRTFKIVTDHSYVNRQKKYAASIEEIFGKENICTTEIHAKFVLIHNDDFNVTIRTSMNLNANKTTENYEIDDDTEIFNFYMNFVEKIVGEMPKGWTSDSYTVSKAVNNFFNENETKTVKKWWTES